MEGQAITPRSELECMLLDESTEPKALPLSLLKDITYSFSDDNKIGSGGFAVVYKGMLDNGTVAVKKLFETLDIHENFSEEIRCLIKAKHKNIVRFLGYCSDTQGEMVDCEGELVLAEVRQRLLCFEYLSKGSLDKQITDASSGLEWRKRYQIIHGICDGLYYLHHNHIIHLDLKPANILLGDNMVPKIADFGISRFFDEKQSHATISNMIGTMGYLAPEFYGHRQITFKLDIYSLGIIIIEIITGDRGYPDIDNVLDRWRNRLEKSQGDKQLEQIRVCIDIAIECTEFSPLKRPDIKHIIGKLGAAESADEFSTETGAGIDSSVVQVVVPVSGPTVALENTMANEVKKPIEELYNITNQNQHFSSIPDNSSNVQQITDIRETASDVREQLIIGRTDDKQKVIAALSGSITPEFTILPIYGIVGIGKTTLAQLIFDDSQFTGYSRVWVHVSQNLDLNRIGNSIISQLSGVSHVAKKQMIHNHLKKLLAGRKILIILDDVWEKNPDTLKTLKTMLRLGVDSMVTIIVTTRDEAIAREICHTVEPYKLETLTDKICWTIIKQKSSFKDRVDKKLLKDIGKEIATKCGGVALAAQSLGYTLNGKTSIEWESVRDNYIWNVYPFEDPSSMYYEVLASLQLSYSHMSECLKLCFSYCAIFPKGHNISKYDLIHQWIALRFIEPSRIFDSMQLCEKYVTQLLRMSFLQYSRTPALIDGRQDKDATLFTMHDLVHDLARASLVDQVNDMGKARRNRCCYALLTDCSRPLQLSVNFPGNIKALHFLDCGKLKLHGDAFSLAKSLHVLDLSECLILTLPGSISRLKQLRFLHAPRIKDRMIPNCITKLSELNYLNLRDSHNISALPESIGDMKGLMHLDLSGCKGIRELPLSFRELKQLVHLDLSNCRMSISEALCAFTNLQYLNLSEIFPINAKHTSGLPEVIGNLTKLKYLNLSRCMKVMAPSPSEDQIHSLVCSISSLSNLEHLDLSHNVELSTIPESIRNLTKLHILDLSGCYHIKKIPDCIVKMVGLEVLIESWGKFVLSQSNFAWSPNFVVHTSSDKCSSNISLLHPTNPDELTIDRLENVKSAEEAQRIELVDKQKIKVLKFQWNVAAGRFVDDKEVLEKLVPPSSVRVLFITGYKSVKMPDWLMDIRQCLPNVEKIELCDFPKCSNLPPLGQLPNLWSLIIRRMEGLEEWDTAFTSGEEGADELMFPKLVALSISQCAKLKLNENSMQLTRLHALSLSRCGSMTLLPQWIGELTSLKKLKIEHCEKIRSLPNSIRQLTKLEYLIIHGCPALLKWCESHMMKLAHIREKFLTNEHEDKMQTPL